VIFGVARDVTQERLYGKNYAQLFKAITENIIYVKTNINGVITEVNSKFCEVSGFNREELVGNTHKLVNSGVHPKSFLQKFGKPSLQALYGMAQSPIEEKMANSTLYKVSSPQC
jgi:PAS domain-containing protein